MNGQREQMNPDTPTGNSPALCVMVQSARNQLAVRAWDCGITLALQTPRLDYWATMWVQMLVPTGHNPFGDLVRAARRKTDKDGKSQ